MSPLALVLLVLGIQVTALGLMLGAVSVADLLVRRLRGVHR